LKIKNLVTIVTAIVLVASSATTVLAQTAKKGLGEKRFYVFFAQGGYEIHPSQQQVIDQVKSCLAEDERLSAFIHARRSNVGWVGENDKKSHSRDGGVTLECLEALADAIGLETYVVRGVKAPNGAWFDSMWSPNFQSFWKKGCTDVPFAMIIVKEDPDHAIRSLQSGQKELEKKVEVQDGRLRENTENIATLSWRENETQQVANSAFLTAEEAKDLAGNNASNIDSLRREIDDLKKTQKVSSLHLRMFCGERSVFFKQDRILHHAELGSNLSFGSERCEVGVFGSVSGTTDSPSINAYSFLVGGGFHLRYGWFTTEVGIYYGQKVDNLSNIAKYHYNALLPVMIGVSVPISDAVRVQPRVGITYASIDFSEGEYHMTAFTVGIRIHFGR
jgi:hypothetical protein